MLYVRVQTYSTFHPTKISKPESEIQSNTSCSYILETFDLDSWILAIFNLILFQLIK